MSWPPRGYVITRVIAPATSLALIAIDQVKAALGIDPADTTQDVWLQQEIDATSAAINNYCDRIFVRQTYRDQIRAACQWLGWGQPLGTRQWPIPVDGSGVPVLTVTEDTVVTDPSLWEVENDTGAVYRLDDTGNIYAWAGMVTLFDYDAGYDTIPADVQSAAIEWMTGRWMQRGQDPSLRSESIPDVREVTYQRQDPATASSMPNGVRDWLGPYRRSYV